MTPARVARTTIMWSPRCVSMEAFWLVEPRPCPLIPLLWLAVGPYRSSDIPCIWFLPVWNSKAQQQINLRCFPALSQMIHASKMHVYIKIVQCFGVQGCDNLPRTDAHTMQHQYTIVWIVLEALNEYRCIHVLSTSYKWGIITKKLSEHRKWSTYLAGALFCTLVSVAARCVVLHIFKLE